MVTWSLEGAAQGPLLTAHWNTFTPTARPLTTVIDAFGVAIVPLPLTSVQVPLAGKMMLLPVSVVEVIGVQSCWSGPAFAVGTLGSKTNTVT